MPDFTPDKFFDSIRRTLDSTPASCTSEHVVDIDDPLPCGTFEFTTTTTTSTTTSTTSTTTSLPPCPEPSDELCILISHAYGATSCLETFSLILYSTDATHWETNHVTQCGNDFYVSLERESVLEYKVTFHCGTVILYQYAENLNCETFQIQSYTGPELTAPCYTEGVSYVILDDLTECNTTSTTTTTPPPCSGQCLWTWNSGTNAWTLTTNPCTGNCSCNPPSFCGTTTGQCFHSNCHTGSPSNCINCNTTTSTTTSSTSTTIPPGCSGCHWRWVGGQWRQNSFDCNYPNCYPCGYPPTPGLNDCDETDTPCAPTTTTSSRPCTGSCSWYWDPDLSLWINVTTNCVPGTETSCTCTCFAPDQPGVDDCATAVTSCNCYSPTTTSGTSTTCSPATTTADPLLCQGYCLWQWTGIEWYRTANFGCDQATCTCDPAPGYSGTSTCDVVQTLCNPTTTTTSTTTTTTTAAPYYCVRLDCNTVNGCSGCGVLTLGNSYCLLAEAFSGGSIGDTVTIYCVDGDGSGTLLSGPYAGNSVCNDNCANQYWCVQMNSGDNVQLCQAGQALCLPNSFVVTHDNQGHSPPWIGDTITWNAGGGVFCHGTVTDGPYDGNADCTGDCTTTTTTTTTTSTTTTTTTPHPTCVQCTGTPHNQYTIALSTAVSNGTCGSCSSFLTPTTISFFGTITSPNGCVWTGSAGTGGLCGATSGPLYVLVVTATFVDLLVGASITNTCTNAPDTGNQNLFACYRSATSWDCASPITLSLHCNSADCNWPASVTITPV